MAGPHSPWVDPGGQELHALALPGQVEPGQMGPHGLMPIPRGQDRGRAGADERALGVRIRRALVGDGAETRLGPRPRTPNAMKLGPPES
jgi:hypothetical protein